MRAAVRATLLLAGIAAGWGLSGALSGGLSGTAQAAEGRPVVVGVRADAKPFSYRLGSGAYDGFIVEFCKRILQAEGLPYVFEDVTAGHRFDRLGTGKIDVLCGPTTVTLARARDFDFSQILFVAGISYLAARVDGPGRKDNKVKVGVLKGTTAEEVAARMLTDKVFAREVDRVTIETFHDSHNQGIGKVCDGSIDFYVGDRDILFQGARDRAGCSAVLSELFFSYEPYALAFKSDGGDLARRFRRAIYGLFSEGQGQAIFQRYFPDRKQSAFLKALFQLHRIPKGHEPGTGH